MRQHQQPTGGDRIEIYAMKQAGKSQRQIASQLGVHSAIISREMPDGKYRTTQMPFFSSKWP